MMASLGTVDWVLAAVLLLSVVVGVVRGLVFEVLSLVGWVAAYVGAQMFASTVAAFVPVGTPGSALNLAVAFGVTFIGVLVGWMVLARVVRMVIQATPLTLIDRALGAVFGLLRGALLLLVVATVVAMTPAGRYAAWRQSVGAGWLDAGLRMLSPWLPEDLARYFPGGSGGR